MATTSFSKLLVEIGVDLAAFSKDLKKVSTGFDRFGSELKKVGRELTIGITAPLAGFAAAALASSEVATQAFAKFGQQTRASMGRIGDDLFRALNIQGILNALSSGLSTLAGAFAALPPVIQTTISVVGVFAAGLGPAILLVGQFSTIVGKASAAWAAFLKVFSGIGLGPIGLLAVAITGIAIAVAALSLSKGRDEFEGLGLSAKKAAADLKEAEETLKRFASFSPDEVAKKLKSLRTELKELQEEMRRGLASADTKARIREITEEIKNLTGEGDVRAARQIVASDAIKKAWAKELEAMKGVAAEFAVTGDEAEKLRGRLAAIVATIAVLKKESPFSPEFRKALIEREDIEGQIRRLNTAEAALKQRQNALLEIQNTIRDAERRQSVLGGGVNLTQVKLDAELQRLAILENTADARERDNAAIAESRARIQALSGPMETFRGLLQSIPRLGQQIGQLLFDITTQFAAGVGQAVANAIIFSQNLGQALLAVLKQVAANVIAALIQMGIQRLITSVVVAAANVKEAAAGGASLLSQIYLGAFLSAVSIPIVGPAIAPGIAAAAAATALAGSLSAGAAGSAALAGTTAAAGAAEGGLFTRPGITRIAEKGEPEIVLNQDNVRRFFGKSLVSSGEGATIHIHLETSGREFAHAVVPFIPSVLRYHGVTI